MKTALQLERDALRTAERLHADRPAAVNRMIFYRFFLPILTIRILNAGVPTAGSFLLGCRL